MERTELLEQLGERFDALPEEVRAAALALAESDPEVSDAVRFSKALASSRAAEFYADPKTSDAEFLVSLRRRIDGVPARPKAMFVTGRRLAVVTSACVVILVAVLAGGKFVPMAPEFEPMASNDEPAGLTSPNMALMEEATPLRAMAKMGAARDAAVTEPVPLDSLTLAEIDPLELAEFLNVEDLAEQTLSTNDDSLPLADELLALDVGTLEEVLSELEQTHFF